MRRFLLFINCVLALTVFCSLPSHSQDPLPSPQQPSAGQEEATPFLARETPSQKSSDTAANVSGAVNNAAPSDKNYDFLSNYVDPTYSNLARLYWALGILDVNDNTMVDNFLTITECDTYKTYKNNDLEWKEIRDVARKYLRDNYKNFPTSFKITIPLYLDRYDSDGEYFDVDQKKSAIGSARKIETIYYTKRITCGVAGEIDGYPRNLILYLNRPFLLPKLPVEKELARLFLDEVNEEHKKKYRDEPVNRRLDRMVYLELMIRVHSFRETVNSAGGMLKAVVFAQIDYIKVYADYEKEKLLYQKDMFEEDRRKRKKRTDAITEEDLSLPEGPIFGYVNEEEKKKE